MLGRIRSIIISSLYDIVMNNYNVTTLLRLRTEMSIFASLSTLCEASHFKVKKFICVLTYVAVDTPILIMRFI